VILAYLKKSLLDHAFKASSLLLWGILCCIQVSSVDILSTRRSRNLSQEPPPPDSYSTRIGTSNERACVHNVKNEITVVLNTVVKFRIDNSDYFVELDKLHVYHNVFELIGCSRNGFNSFRKTDIIFPFHYFW